MFTRFVSRVLPTRCSKLNKYGLCLQTRSIHRLPELAYEPSKGVPPVFSAEGARQHFDSFHRHDCVRLNHVLGGSGHELSPLEHVIIIYRKYPQHAHIFNAASSVYNHKFMWLCIAPHGKPISSWLTAYFTTHFGNVGRFKAMWKASCKSLFGSGWCWLVDSDGHLEIVATPNAGNPVGRNNIFPILVIDLWEHAYFHDFGTDRDAYVDNWFNAVDWTFVEFMIRRIKQDQRITPHPELGMPRANPDYFLENEVKISPDNPFLKMQKANSDDDDED